MKVNSVAPDPNGADLDDDLEITEEPPVRSTSNEAPDERMDVDHAQPTVTTAGCATELIAEPTILPIIETAVEPVMTSAAEQPAIVEPAVEPIVEPVVKPVVMSAARTTEPAVASTTPSLDSEAPALPPRSPEKRKRVPFADVTANNAHLENRIRVIDIDTCTLPVWLEDHFIKIRTSFKGSVEEQLLLNWITLECEDEKKKVC